MFSVLQAPDKQPFCRGRQNACLSEPASSLQEEAGFAHRVFNMLRILKTR